MRKRRLLRLRTHVWAEAEREAVRVGCALARGGGPGEDGCYIGCYNSPQSTVLSGEWARLRGVRRVGLVEATERAVPSGFYASVYKLCLQKR